MSRVFSRSIWIGIILLLFIIAGVGSFVLVQSLNSPQRQLQQAVELYGKIDLKTVSSLGWDTLYSLRENYIRRARKAEQALVAGDKALAKSELSDLEKRIKLQSKANARGGIVGLDGDGDGIDDYIEPFYDVIVSVHSKI